MQPPIVMTAGFDIEPPPANIAAGDDDAARAYLQATEDIHPDDKEGEAEPRDWEVERVLRPCERTYDDDLDLAAVNMSSSFAHHDYGFLEPEEIDNGPADVMYFNNPKYPTPTYFDEFKTEFVKFRAKNDAYTWCRLKTMVTYSSSKERDRMKEEIQARKELSRKTNVAFHNYKKMVASTETICTHLAGVSEHIFSVRDWISKIFEIVKADRLSEQDITDTFLSKMATNFIREEQGAPPAEVPARKADGGGSKAVSEDPKTPAPERRQPHRFAKAVGPITPSGFINPNHVNFSPPISQEGALDGQVADDDIDHDAGDDDPDVLLSAKRLRHERFLERARRRGIKIDGKINGCDDGSTLGCDEGCDEGWLLG